MPWWPAVGAADTAACTFLAFPLIPFTPAAVIGTEMLMRMLIFVVWPDRPLC